MKEKESHKAAFEAYHALGPARSLTTLSEQTGVSRSTLRNWSAAFRWQDRIEERDRDVAKVTAARTARAEVKERVKERQLVELGLVTLARQIAEGKVKGTLGDLDRLIRLERFLEGEADSRQEVIARELQGKNPEELRAMLRRELAELAVLSGADDWPPAALAAGAAELATPPPDSVTEEGESATEDHGIGHDQPRGEEAEEAA